jgi:hypothetical protein
MLTVMPAFEPVVCPVVLTVEITMQPAVLSPRHVVVVMSVGVLMLQLVVRPVMLPFQPIVLAIMTVGIAGLMCRSRCRQRGGRNGEPRREKILTHLALLFDSRTLAQVR